MADPTKIRGALRALTELGAAATKIPTPAERMSAALPVRVLDNAAATTPDVAGVVKDLVGKYRLAEPRNFSNASHINMEMSETRNCNTFAHDLQKLLPGSRVAQDGNHVFVEYGGRYYDSETPNGVDSHLKLPHYRNTEPGGKNLNSKYATGKLDYNVQPWDVQGYAAGGSVPSDPKALEQAYKADNLDTLINLARSVWDFGAGAARGVAAATTGIGGDLEKMSRDADKYSIPRQVLRGLGLDPTVARPREEPTALPTTDDRLRTLPPVTATARTADGDAYTGPVLTGQALGSLVPLLPGGATHRAAGAALSRATTPLARWLPGTAAGRVSGAIGELGGVGSAGARAGAGSRALDGSGGALQALAQEVGLLPGASHAVKPRGGNWSPDALRTMQDEAASAVLSAKAKLDRPVDFNREVAVEDWFKRHGINYLRNDMGTATDPIVRMERNGQNVLLTPDEMQDNAAGLGDYRNVKPYLDEYLSQERAKDWLTRTDPSDTEYPTRLHVAETGRYSRTPYELMTDRLARPWAPQSAAELSANISARLPYDVYHALEAGAPDVVTNTLRRLAQHPTNAPAWRAAQDMLERDARRMYADPKSPDELFREMSDLRTLVTQNAQALKAPPDAYFHNLEPGSTLHLNWPVLAKYLMQSDHPTDKLMRIGYADAVRMAGRDIRDREIAEKKRYAQLTANKDVEVAHQFPEGWRVVRLNKPGQFHQESDMMSNSVRGFEWNYNNRGLDPTRINADHQVMYGSALQARGGWPGIENGDQLIYSLRDPQNRPHATLQYLRPAPNEPHVLWQAQGPNNEHVGMEAFPYLMRFLQSKGGVDIDRRSLYAGSRAHLMPVPDRQWVEDKDLPSGVPGRWQTGIDEWEPLDQ